MVGRRNRSGGHRATQLLGSVLFAVVAAYATATLAAGKNPPAPPPRGEPADDYSLDDILEMDIEQLTKIAVVVPSMDVEVTSVTRTESTVGRSPAAIFVITPEMITSRMEVRKGDILIYNTGYHRYFNGGPEEDEERYFLRHPGGDRRLAEWIVEMELAWTGFDCGSGDHPMNTSIRYKRADAAKAFEVEVESRLAEQMRAWAETLRELSWVDSVAVEGSTARVVVNDVGTARRELMAAAVQSGLALTRYEMVRPSLEDVFLKLVNAEGA